VSALIAALDREIDVEADDKNALAPADRSVKEAEVLGDLLAVERDESTLVWIAQAQNLPAEHRPDVSPLALLGLRLLTTPPAAALPADTSPGLAIDFLRPGGR
jgi:hypothetical protein